MKYIKYIIIALTAAFAAACAEEEPCEFGSLDAKASVSQITDTSATINVDLTNCAEIFEQIPFNLTNSNYCYVSICESSEYSWSVGSFAILDPNKPNELTLTGSVIARGLKPSTTYTFCIDIPSPIGKIGYRSAEYTFTTLREFTVEDYLDLISPYEVAIGDQLAILDFVSILNLKYLSATISKNSDMTDPLTPSVKDGFQGFNASYEESRDLGDTEYEYSIAFKGLEPNTTYYWYMEGTLNTDTKYKSPTYSFTTSDAPNPIVSSVVSSVVEGIELYPDYCYIYNFFNFYVDNFHCFGSFYFPQGFVQDQYNYKLEYSKDYAYILTLSGSGRHNGHYVGFWDFIYHNTLRTPDKQ